VLVNTHRQCGANFVPFSSQSPRTLILVSNTTGVFAGGAAMQAHSAGDLNWSAYRGNAMLEIVGSHPSTPVSWRFTLDNLPGGPAPGTYAVVPALSGPRLSISGGPSFGCHEGTGQFRILDIAFGDGASVTRLSADFEVRCSFSPGAPLVRGAILFNAVGSVGQFFAPATPEGLRIVR
jgi:hypothetical protein